MRKLATCPARIDGAYSRWSDYPTADVQHMLDRLDFTPVHMHIFVETGIWQAAKVLGLTVPDRGEEGMVELVPGVPVQYLWGSIDGRATEWLQLTGQMNGEALKAFVAKLQAAMPIERRRDLQVTVSSEAVSGA